MLAVLCCCCMLLSVRILTVLRRMIHACASQIFLFDVRKVPDKTKWEWILMKHTRWHRYTALSAPYWCSTGCSACIFTEFAMCTRQGPYDSNAKTLCQPERDR